MDFPKANFPNPLTTQTTRREVFFEYGSHGYADVSSTYGQKIEAFCQKVPEGFQGKRDSLCAKRPTLPLSQRPNDVHMNGNDVMGKIFKLQKEAQNFTRLVKHYNVKNQTLSSKVKRQLRSYHSSSTVDNRSELHTDVVQKLAQQYKQFRDLSDIPKTNSEYAGGCLSCLQGSGLSGSNTDCRLVSAVGNNLSQLRITDITINRKDLTLQPTRHQVIEVTPVREVTTRCVYGKEHIAVRGLMDCSLYSLDNSDLTLVGKEGFTSEQERPTSVCLSSYIPGECLVSTATGAVFLWSPSDRQKQVIKERSTRFTCTLPWRRAEFGAHPREVIATDPTVVQLFDIRRSSSKPGVDLFALPSPLVMSGERIHLSTQSTASEFHHFVACDYSFFLIDQRFPGTPVLSWKHMLVNPPQYFDGVNFPTKGHSLVLMASQSPPEVCCYKYSCSSGMAAQAMGAPWRVSRIDDLFHHRSVCGGTAGAMVSERFDTSLIGVTTIPMEDGLFVIQADSYGEVFYQGYNFVNDGRDKTCSMETDTQPWDDITIRKGRKWISRYVKSQEKNKNKKSKEILRQPENNFFREITLQKQPHIGCPLCHPEKETTSNYTDRCPACHQSLATGQQLVQTGKGLVGYWPDDIKLLGVQSEFQGLQIGGMQNNTPSSRNKNDVNQSQIRRTQENERFPQTNALSKILVALWEEENPNLTELLLQRDEEIEKRKESVKETRKKKSNKLMDEDQQLMRRLQQAVDGGSRNGPQPPGGAGSGRSSLSPGGSESQHGSSTPGGSRNTVSPSWIDNRVRESDGEDSDASFHRLFGIDVSTLREEDYQDSADIIHSRELANKETSYRKNRNFTNSKSSKKRKHSTSESLLSDDQRENVARQPTDNLEVFSMNDNDRVTHTNNDDPVEDEDDWDSQFFSQDIAQSFTMFSGSFLSPSPATLTSGDPQLSLTSKPWKLQVTDSPNTEWKSHKKKGRFSIGGF